MRNPGTPLRVPLEARVGPQLLGPGDRAPLRLDRLSAISLSRAHPRFAEALVSGNCFYATSGAATDLGNALKTSANTLTIFNPPGSGIVVSLLHASVALTAVPTGTATRWGSLTLAANIDPTVDNSGLVTTQAVNWGNALLGANPSKGAAMACTAATLPEKPSAVRSLGGWSISPGGGAGSTGLLAGSDKVDGAIALIPNTALTLQGILAGGTWAGTVTMLWEEIAL